MLSSRVDTDILMKFVKVICHDEAWMPITLQIDKMKVIGGRNSSNFRKILYT